MTSDKELISNKVLHMPDIHQNLVSDSLLNKNIGFKFVFVFDKFILTKNEMFVGKGSILEYMMGSLSSI